MYTLGQVSLLIQKLKTKLPANETVQLIDIQIQTCVLMPSYSNLKSLKHWSWGTYRTQHLHELCRFPLETNSISRTLDSWWICKRTTISKNCPEQNFKKLPTSPFLPIIFLEHGFHYPTHETFPSCSKNVLPMML